MKRKLEDIALAVAILAVGTAMTTAAYWIGDWVSRR